MYTFSVVWGRYEVTLTIAPGSAAWKSEFGPYFVSFWAERAGHSALPGTALSVTHRRPKHLPLPRTTLSDTRRSTGQCDVTLPVAPGGPGVVLVNPRHFLPSQSAWSDTLRHQRRWCGKVTSVPGGGEWNSPAPTHCRMRSGQRWVSPKT